MLRNTAARVLLHELSVLLGGLCYQPHAPACVNLAHAYGFFAFAAIPYAISLAVEGEARRTALFAYVAVVGFLFALTKLANHALHLVLGLASSVEPEAGGAESAAQAEPPPHGEAAAGGLSIPATPGAAARAREDLLLRSHTQTQTQGPAPEQRRPPSGSGSSGTDEEEAAAASVQSTPRSDEGADGFEMVALSRPGAPPDRAEGQQEAWARRAAARLGDGIADRVAMRGGDSRGRDWFAAWIRLQPEQDAASLFAPRSGDRAPAARKESLPSEGESEGASSERTVPGREGSLEGLSEEEGSGRVGGGGRGVQEVGAPDSRGGGVQQGGRELVRTQSLRREGAVQQGAFLALLEDAEKGTRRGSVSGDCSAFAGLDSVKVVCDHVRDGVGDGSGSRAASAGESSERDEGASGLPCCVSGGRFGGFGEEESEEGGAPSLHGDEHTTGESAAPAGGVAASRASEAGSLGGGSGGRVPAFGRAGVRRRSDGDDGLYTSALVGREAARRRSDGCTGAGGAGAKALYSGDESGRGSPSGADADARAASDSEDFYVQYSTAGDERAEVLSGTDAGHHGCASEAGVTEMRRAEQQGRSDGPGPEGGRVPSVQRTGSVNRLVRALPPVMPPSQEEGDSDSACLGMMLPSAARPRVPTPEAMLADEALLEIHSVRLANMLQASWDLEPASSGAPPGHASRTAESDSSWRSEMASIRLNPSELVRAPSTRPAAGARQASARSRGGDGELSSGSTDEMAAYRASMEPRAVQGGGASDAGAAGRGDDGVFTYVDENGELQQYVFYSGDQLRTLGLDQDSNMASLAMVLNRMDNDVPSLAALGRGRGVRVHLRNRDAPRRVMRPSKFEWSMKGRSYRVLIPFDRIALESCLDRTYGWEEVAFSGVAWIASACIAALTLHLYSPTAAVFLCLALAAAQYRYVLHSCCLIAALSLHLNSPTAAVFSRLALTAAQYSLVKSPQPDAGSPYSNNPLAAYTRAVAFTLTGLLALSLDSLVANLPDPQRSFVVYGVTLHPHIVCVVLRDVLLSAQLLLPAVFALGWMPQAHTLLHHFLEQVHIHVFGGSGTQSLLAAILASLLSSASVVAVWLVASPAFGDAETVASSPRVSIAIGLCAVWSYVICRVPSDLSLIALMWAGGSADGLVRDVGVSNLLISSRQLRRKRLRDALIGICLGACLAGIHATGVFSYAPWAITFAASCAVLALSVPFELGLPPLRYAHALLIFQKPLIASAPFAEAEASPTPPPFSSWDRATLLVGRVQSSVLYPFLITTLASTSSESIARKWGSVGGAIWVGCVFKLMRTGMQCDAPRWAPLALALSLSAYDLFGKSETMLVDLAAATIIASKVREFWLKISFIAVYAAPWSFPWGSAVHALLQILGLPHTLLGLAQAAWASVISAPVFPIAGAVFFLMSYPRPVRFWEKHFQSAPTAMENAADREAGRDNAYRTNNLNSCFYEHLTLALRRTLAKSIAAGQLGCVRGGSVFFLLSDTLTAIVHIIERGQGYVAFQLRGLEFHGTFCQDRELEAIREPHTAANFFSHVIPKLAGGDYAPLAIESMIFLRWNVWTVINDALRVPTYNINLNPAAALFSGFFYKGLLINHLVKCVSFFLLSLEDLEEIMACSDVAKEITKLAEGYVERGAGFHPQVNKDHDYGIGGITLRSFAGCHGPWVAYCEARIRGSSHAEAQTKSDNFSPSSVHVGTRSAALMGVCMMASTVARRALLPSRAAMRDVSFLNALHDMIANNIRSTNAVDQWAFARQEKIIEGVICLAMRTALKLHVDYFADGEEEASHESIYDAIKQHVESGPVVQAEGQSLWRDSILSDAKELLTLRQSSQEGDSEPSEHRVLQLHLRNMEFRVVEINAEAVRGLWSGQQHELVFLGNQNRERGSIQQMKACLRNLVNQSIDPPSGYPIFVSPVVTSLELD